jgi:hypothetical protein
MILLPLVASSLGGFHSAWAHLYETLALYWQQRGEGRDGDAEKTAMVARWLSEASTSLQRGHYSVIMALAHMHFPMLHEGDTLTQLKQGIFKGVKLEQPFA